MGSSGSFWCCKCNRYSSPGKEKEYSLENYYNDVEDKKSQLEINYISHNKNNSSINGDLIEIDTESNFINEFKNTHPDLEKEKILKEKLINNKSQENQKRENNLKLSKKILNEFKKITNKIEEREIPKRYKPILIGLNNIGSTNYMNAILQCLSNTKDLSDYFLNIYKEDPNNTMANEYHKLILNLWNRENNNISYSPYSFKEVIIKENPLFTDIEANDSIDLINFLLERLHQELNSLKNINNNINKNILSLNEQTNEQYMLNSFIKEFKENYNSQISNLFYGIMEAKSQCFGCNAIKYNFQIYSFLEFPLQQINQYFFDKREKQLINNDGKNQDIDLYECFEYYRKKDFFTGDNQMYCNICKELNDLYYSTSIYSAPSYLIINLNRGKGEVYDCKVNFPEILNIFNFVSYKNGKKIFDLYAVICHLGTSSLNSHFVAYCKNKIDNKWYLYNNETVSLCNKNKQYQDGIPYVLFYKVLE